MSALHGWPGLLSAYASLQGPLMAALAQARAPLRQWLLSPLLAAPLTALAGLSIAAAPLLRGLAAGGAALEVSAAAALSAALGYGVGRVLARRAAPGALHQRGALVLDEAPCAPDAAGSGRARRGRRSASP